MRICSLDEFHACPDGRYTTGDGWFAWHTGARRFGISLKGRFGLDQLQLIATFARRQQAVGANEDQALLDVRAVTDISPRILELALPVIGLCAGNRRPVLHYVGNAQHASTNLLGRLCWSWKSVGFHVHEDFEAAAAAMAIERGQALSIRCALAEWWGDDVVRRLSRVMDEDPYACTLEGAAVRLGVSARSLQRSLRRDGTSFRELRHAKLRDRYEGAVLSNEKLDAIGATLGHASLQSFSADFRRLIGCSPSEYRKRAHRSTEQDNRS